MKKSEKKFQPMISAREARNMTQAEFAELLGISSNYVHLIESGHKSPGPKILEKLAQIESAPPDKVDECSDLYRTKTVAEQWAETSDEQFEKILLKCVEIKDWGGVEKMAAELHRRKLAEINRKLGE